MEKIILSASVPVFGALRISRTKLSAIHAKEKDTTRVHVLAQEEENTNQKGRARETTAKEIGAKEEKEIGKAEKEKEKDMGAKDMVAKATEIRVGISKGKVPALHLSRTSGASGANPIGMHGGQGLARVGQVDRQHHG